MRETEYRIEKYKRELRYLKEKVTVSTVLFAISFIMMIATSFAWISLSMKPEIMGIQTTITANGNLEIALSDKEGEEPSKSEPGDSNLPLVKRNLTWGNLVNLSDKSYGFDKAILRPASLNAASLLNAPLFGAEYGDDGRINKLSNSFAYATYDVATKSFVVPVKEVEIDGETKQVADTWYGVRAISSVRYDVAGLSVYLQEAHNDVTEALLNARSAYSNVIREDNINAISAVMGDYLTATLNDDDLHDFQAHIPSLKAMMDDLAVCMDKIPDAYATLGSLQSLTSVESIHDRITYNWAKLSNASNEELLAIGYTEEEIQQLHSFMEKYEDFKVQHEKLDSIQNGTTVYWSELKDIVNFLVVINEVTVDEYTVAQLYGDKSLAVSILQRTGRRDAVIREGLLCDIERILGTRMGADMTIHVNYLFALEIKATIRTASSPDDYIATMTEKALERAGGIQGTDPVAAETFGLAIDFWVRSNSNDFLVLEGNTIVTEKDVYIHRETGETLTKKIEDDSYYNSRGEKVDNEEVNVQKETVVEGYEGVNRVWDSEYLDTINSVTQGNGSCYVFYADSPQMQKQILDTLSAMSIAFVSEEGELLANAAFDVDYHYAVKGRVTVPIILLPTSIKVTDDKGDYFYAISELIKGEAKRVTAIMYLDGNKVENADVLDRKMITGQLNLQFGSRENTEATMDGELYYEEVNITATASPVTEIDGRMCSDIHLDIKGIEPSTVEGYFVRVISDTQGTKQEVFTFDMDSMSAKVFFDAPGTYLMERVTLDGIEYILGEKDSPAPIEIVIEGYSIPSVNWNDGGSNYKEIMRADSAYTQGLNVVIANGNEPKSVIGYFANKNNQQISVVFGRGTDAWYGNVTFTNSGVYHMQYLQIDGEYYEIPEAMQKTMDISLGVKAVVYVNGPKSEPSLEYVFNSETLKDFDVSVVVIDNGGNKIISNDVDIQYAKSGSNKNPDWLQGTLLWNEASQMYKENADSEKFIIAEPGRYTFGFLTIDGVQLDTADAPVIIAVPPNPPTFEKNVSASSVFAYGSDAVMKIRMNDASSCSITAVMEKLGYEETLQFNIQGEVEGNVWKFAIPTTTEMKKIYPEMDELTMLGDWKLTSLRIAGAYINEEVTTDESPLIIDLSEEKIVTTVHDQMKVSVSGAGQLIQNPLFALEGKVTSGLSVVITGSGDEAIDAEKITNGLVTYQLDVDSITCVSDTNSEGYYTEDSNATKEYLVSNGTVTSRLKADGNSNQFILDNGLSLPYAGVYNIKEISYMIDGNTYIVSVEETEDSIEFIYSDAPRYTMNWEKPVITITSVNPNTETDITINSGSSDYLRKADIPTTTKRNSVSADGFSCDVYFKVTPVSRSLLGTKYGCVSAYTPSKVETTLTNVSAFYNASITVDGTGTDVNYTYTPNLLSVSNSAGENKEWQVSFLGKTIGTCQRVFVDGSAEYIKITSVDQTITYVFKLANKITINTPESEF